ncbi:uncharacterized protein Z520_02973 [Fonsecaea multimorphosa CBS 102226]|uniref:Uncharacterized protein n=1 Tax=Fonsecaea multimorphosa CBS 102226 TaxID=1442371 RepID=A0A0D2HHS4_9EURO|nr:uncharacterized protein Z520_02973 [Fonsecaea multimorphosa CBS 102226]KIY01421.1 hypothetical protein Z520_02973 [Fonsecaea multimorphosa CBS 102226]OAL28439.1 hypothetical protein AYO22_02893 [Fonsecaea multimorphosa]
MSMAARIIHLLKKGHTYGCIPCHVVEEFDQEIDKESIEALLEKDFDVTKEALPGTGGEHIIPTIPAVDADGYVSGVVIPSGIYHEIISLRHLPAGFLKDYVRIRWSFRVSEPVITEAINAFLIEQGLRHSSHPELQDVDDSIPEHDGRHLHNLATTSEEEPDVEAFNNPPPDYEPRPEFRGIQLRHPREVNPIDGQLPPFFENLTLSPAPPDYSAEMDPPSYDNMHVNLETRPSGSSSPPSPTVRQRSNQPSGETSSSVTPTVQADLPAFQGLAEQPNPIKCFSRSNVVDFLFDGLHEIDIYPDGPFEPVRLQDEGLRNMKAFTLLLAVARIDPYLGPTEHFAEFITHPENDEPPILTPEGELVKDVVLRFFREMYISGCGTSREALRDYPGCASFAGFCFMINHMRLNRGAPEVYSHTPAAFLEPVLDELRLSGNHSVMKVLGRCGSDVTETAPSLKDLVDLFDEISLQRLISEPVALDFWPKSTLHSRLVHPGFEVDGAVRDWLRRKKALLTFDEAVQLAASLVDGRDHVSALLESTGQDFLVSRRSLEAFVADAMRMTEGTPENGDVGTIIAQIRGLRDIWDAYEISAEWWAAAMTNIAVVRAQPDRCSELWVDMMPTTGTPQPVVRPAD